MNQSGLSVRLATLLIVIAALAWFSPVPAQDDTSCSAIVTVVDDQGAAVPAGHTISLMFSPVDLRQQVTDGISTSYAFEGLSCGNAMAALGAGDASDLELALLNALVREMVTLEPGVSKQVLLVIPAMTTVSITAMDGDGVPAAGGTVTAFPAIRKNPDLNSARFAMLSPEGTGIMKFPKGRYMLLPSFPEGQEVERIAVDGVDLEREEAFEIGDRPSEILIIVSSAEKITGQVTDERGGPISRYQVIVKKPESNYDQQYAVLRKDGRFAVSTAAFPVELFIHDPDGEWSFEPVSVQVADREHADGLHFTARRIEGKNLKGKVVAGDPAVPVARALISNTPNCYTETGERTVDRPVQVFTDEEGEFQVPCPDHCFLSLEITRMDTEEYLPLHWYGGQTECETNKTFVLQKGNTITGVVSDVRGDPVAQLVIDTMTRGKGGVTDSEGRYRITNLISGRYELQVKGRKDTEFSPYILVPDAAGNRPAVRFQSTGETANLDLEVTLGGSVCLDLEDETGQPVVVDYLELVLPDESHPAKVASRYIGPDSTQSDPLCVGPLAPGDYHLRAGNRFSMYLPAWWPGAKDREEAALVNILAGDRLEIGPMTARRAGSVQVSIKEGYFLKEQPPYLAFRELARELTEKQNEWDVVDREELHYMAERKERTDKGQPSYATLRFTPYPIGMYEVRVCETEECEKGNIWCSSEPLVIEKRKGGEVELVLSDDPECKVKVIDMEIHSNDNGDSTVPTIEKSQGGE